MLFQLLTSNGQGQVFQKVFVIQLCYTHSHELCNIGMGINHQVNPQIIYFLAFDFELVPNYCYKLIHMNN